MPDRKKPRIPKPSDIQWVDGSSGGHPFSFGWSESEGRFYVAAARDVVVIP